MSDLAELLREKARLENERDRIVAAIHELRSRARQKSLEASSTRVPLAQTEIEFWKFGIAKHQAELLAVQAKLGEVNKELRKGKPEHPHRLRTLSQCPSEVAVKGGPGGALNSNGSGIQAPCDLKEGHVLFLQFFHQLIIENIDPRLVEVFEKDAHGLVNDYRRMHQEKS